jgi:hypothetical protein
LIGHAPTAVGAFLYADSKAKRARESGNDEDAFAAAATAAASKETLMFFQEASVLLQMLLAFLNSKPSKSKTVEKGGGEDQASNWSSSSLSLVSALSSIATSTFQGNPSDTCASAYSSFTLRAVEMVLLSSMSSSSLSNSGAPLLSALTQAIHIALHCEEPVGSLLAVANRTLLAASTCKPFSLHTHSLLASILDTAGSSSKSTVLARLPSLHPGVFALMDSCADPKHKKKLLALLVGEQARAVYMEVNDKYVREYQFKGRV